MTTDVQKTTDVTQSELILGLSKEGLAYQTLLQECENVKFTKDNLNEERSALVNLRKVKSKLTAIQNPFTASWKNWNSSMKSLLDPVDALLTKKEGEFRTVSREIEAENQRIEAEKQRIASIKHSIDTFFLEQSQAISVAKTTEELVRIEKLIGSHKSAARYGEFLPLMANKAQNLTQLIKTQKDAIKKIADLRAQEELAEASGDDQTVLDLREHQELIAEKMEQAKINIQEVSIKMATQADVIEPEVIVPIAPRPRRQVWEWKVFDIKQTAKKMPDWVALSINESYVDEYLKVKKAEGIEGEKFEFAGIRFFLNKSY